MEGSISIIIPTLNRREMLKEALDSIQSQTQPCLEVIVIDAGHDGSDELAKSYPFVRYYRQQTKGLTSARNEALQYARGDYVGMLDSDDYYAPQFLERCSAILDSRPGVAVAYARGFTILAKGEILGELLQGHKPPGDTLRGLLHDNFVIASLCLMRRSMLQEVGGYDESIRHWGDDYDLILRIVLQGGGVEHVPAPLAYRRRHAGSPSSSAPVEGRFAIRKILEKLSPRLRSYFGTSREFWMSNCDLLIGRHYFDAGQLDKAQGWFLRAIGEDPRNWRCLVYLLWCRFYPVVNPVARLARTLKRALFRFLSKAGLVEKRWPE